MRRTRSAADALRPIATDDGLYTILAIDHGASLRRLLALGDGPDADEAFYATKRAVLEVLAEQCSAVLLDAGLALSLGRRWELPPDVGLIVGLDAPDYDDVVCPPPALPPEELFDRAQEVGCDALKIVLYYDPDAGDAAWRRRAVTLIAERCAARSLPLLVEPLPLPDSAGGCKERQWPILTVVEHIAAGGADLIKLPLPLAGDTKIAETCAEITATADGVPWILLSSGAPYDEFMEKLRMALTGGASGFAAGRSLWDDLVVEVDSEMAARDAVERLVGAVQLTESLGRGGTIERAT